MQPNVFHPVQSTKFIVCPAGVTLLAAASIFCLSLKISSSVAAAAPAFFASFKSLFHFSLTIDKVLESEILKFLNEVKSKNEEYEIFYMKEQRIDDKFLNRLINFFRFEIKNIYKDIKHNLKNALLKRISPINPYKLNFFTRIMIKKKRAENLSKSYLKLIDSSLITLKAGSIF